ncbi:MAG: hypothetical protein ACFB15_07080 [Cyclobacteriaceae bacterium]
MYILTQLGFIVLTLLCLWAILRQLHQALSKADWSETKKQRLWIRTLMGLGAWLLFISVASLSGFFSDFSSFPPRVVTVITIPFITILLIIFSRSINAILKVIPPQNLLYIQAFRVIVEVLLWMLFLQELLPEQMTFEGRNWDILVGLTAPLMAYFGLVRENWSRSLIIVWNVLGLMLLANIVTIAILSMPTPFRVFTNEPSNTIVATFPFVWLPGVLVPIAYSIHFFSLKQLLLSQPTAPEEKPAQEVVENE